MRKNKTENIIKNLLCTMIFIAICVSFYTPAIASSLGQLNYDSAFSYNYDTNGKSVQTPPYYYQNSQIKDDFSGAEDLFILKQTAYILDVKNSRILMYNLENMQKIGEIKSKEADFADGKGLFVTEDENIYVTQYKSKKVVKIDKNGKLLQTINKPISNLIDKTFNYKPIKVAVQKNGLIYVISEGAYDGVVQFSSKGEFNNFFGSNKVKMTVQMILAKFWSKYFTDIQKKRIQLALPTNYSSLAISKDDFVYACTSSTDIDKNQIKKLSPYGNDVTNTAKNSTFGDLESVKISGLMTKSTFSDLAVDSYGIINALDSRTGRVFQYDTESNLLGLFGGIGNQNGSFEKPIAVDVYNDQVYVLDSGRGILYKYSPTDYGTDIRSAIKLYAKGMFLEAEPYWREVYRNNSNLAWVSSGLGQAAIIKGEYILGMQYFKSAQDVVGYNECYSAFRISIINNYFWIFFLVFLAAFLAIWILINRSIHQDKPAFETLGNKKVNPFQLLAHPSAFEIMKYENKGSSRMAIVMLIILIFVRIVSLSNTGFLFNPEGGQSYNYIMEGFQVLILFICVVACNWAVGTFMDGEGKIQELFIAFAYAILPYCMFTLLGVLLSNVFTLREAVLIGGIQALGIYWSLLLLFMAIMRTSGYSFLKTVLSILFTIVALIFVLFLIITMVTLVDKIFSFAKQLYEELRFKI